MKKCVDARPDPEPVDGRMNVVLQDLTPKLLICQCELTDKAPPDMWERFVKLGADYGIEEEELDALYRRAQERGKKRA